MKWQVKITLHNENNKKTNWQTATLDDIAEIKNALEYARGLVIKSEAIGEAYETVQSTRNATRYISAVLGLNDTDDVNRQVIIDNYKETNQYYIYLLNTYNIPIVDARTASDMKILKVVNKVLSHRDEMLFLDCYDEVVKYYKQVFFTKAFINQQYNLQFFILTVVNMAVQRYLTRKLKFYFDIDTYTKKQLKNSFISYGFDYFDILPTNYQRRLLKILNDLVISKGTNHDIRKILDIFGNKNIDIYKYILSKLYPIKGDGSYDYDSPYLIFYKTLADGIIDYDKDIVLNYDSVTEGDILWKVDKEEVLYNRRFNKETEDYEIVSDRHFNTIISKYMSIDITTDILVDTMKMSYLFNFLYKFEKDYKDKQDENDFGFFNREMSSTKIPIFTAIVGFISLMLKKLGLNDVINFFPNQLNDIYGYNNFESNDDVKDLLREIQILLIQNRDELIKSRKYTKLYRYFRGFTLYNFETPNERLTLDSLYEMAKVNSNIENQLSTGLKRYCDYIPLNDYLENEEHDLVDKLEFLRKCLIKGKLEPRYVSMYEDLTKCFREFIIIEGYKYPETRSEIGLAFIENKYIVDESAKYVKQVKYSKVTEAYNKKDLIAFFDAIHEFTLKHRADIIKKYNLDTDEKLQIFLYSDVQDITYYKNLYAYMILFYYPFKNEKEENEKKFTISQFMKIYYMNEDVRLQLIEFIKDTNNWQLYYRYNKLFNQKFLTKQDTSLYKPYTHFSEYVKNSNYEFYKWITEKDEDIKNGLLTPKEKKQYFREKLFELAESIDTYLGTDLFTNFPLSGILDFIVLTLYLIATVFKAFTVDLIKSDSVLRVDDSAFNAIRLFDEVPRFDINMELKSYVKIEDVFREFIKLKYEDNSFKDSLKDEFTIKEYTDGKKNKKIPLFKETN